MDTFKVIMYAGDEYSKSTFRALGLNSRQLKALAYLKSDQELTNAEYQRLFQASEPTATHDLTELVAKGLISREGKTGKGTIYRLVER